MNEANLRALPTGRAVAYLAKRWNLTEEMARRRWQRESDAEVRPDMKAAAVWYVEHGIPVFPCKPRSKKPLTPHGFQDATCDSDQIAKWWDKWPLANIGIPTGATSGLLVVDEDPRNGGDQSVNQLIMKHGPFPDTAEQITGGGGRHRVFRDPGCPVPKSLAVGIDLKGLGGYILAAPSLHPSGKRYEWDGIAGAKALLSPADPPLWLLKHITDAKAGNSMNGNIPRVLPDVIPDGKKHHVIFSLIGTVKSRGLPEQAAFAACRALQFGSPVSDEDIWERIKSCYRLYPPSERSEPPSAWAEPLPIQSELPPVQAFTLELLPNSFRPLVRDVADRMQVPMDFPAVVMVLCLAGAVNRRATIQPKASDTGWVVTPNLWGGIIAQPGFMKSPVIQAATRPLNLIQTEWRREHEQAMKDYARQREEYELRRAAWKEQYKAASKKGDAAPDRPEDEPQEPKLRRLILNDATFEALHQTMAENPAGILVIRDELTGWLSRLDREEFGTERAFALQAWNGDAAYTVDRIGRGTIHVPACCMSLLGGIQPGRLRSYLADALHDGPSNDGLSQRFQVLVWPDMESDWTYIDRAPDAAAEELVARVFRKLVELEEQSPALFLFAPDAQELFIEWLTELEAKVRGDELHPALISHLSKYRSLMPSLALLFELADRASSVGFDGSSLANSQNFVSLEHTRQAAAFCEYLESHAQRVYSCVVNPQLRAARELAEKIKQRKVGANGVFCCRDVYLKCWSGLDTPEAVKMAAEVLQDAGWVRNASGESRPSGGRPSNRYEVNPGVWK